MKSLWEAYVRERPSKKEIVPTTMTLKTMQQCRKNILKQKFGRIGFYQIMHNRRQL